MQNGDLHKVVYYNIVRMRNYHLEEDFCPLVER
jgi:hypothetical protein